MEDHPLAFGEGKVRLVEPGQGHQAGAGDVLPGMLVGLADVDEEGALVEQALGFVGLRVGSDMVDLRCGMQPFVEAPVILGIAYLDIAYILSTHNPKPNH